MAKKQNIPPTPKPVAPNKTGAVKEAVPKAFAIQLKLALLLGVVALLVYANTLRNGYALDDILNVKKNEFVNKGLAGIPDILSTPYHRGSLITSNDLYRPLSLVSFAIEYQLFGQNPGANHFINILLFACCVILLFLFLDKLFVQKKTVVAFIAALLFALHPIHTEVVANIKSRDELLCFFFAFLSLNTFIKYTETNKTSQLLLGAFCFLLSLFSKETAITFIAVIPMLFFFYRNANKKSSINITICSILMAVIFVGVRHSVLSTYDANDSTNINFIDNALAQPGLSFESRIATAILILGYYLKLLLIPYPLVCDYSYNSIPFAHFSSPAVLVSLIVFVAIAVYSIKLFLKNNKDPYAFGLLFFLVTIALFSNLFFLIGATMGERFLFFPSVGLCLVIALLVEKLSGKQAPTGMNVFRQPAMAGITIPMCLVYAALTISRNSDWLDSYTLYSADVKKMPDNSRLNYYLGSELEKVVAPEEKDPEKQKKIITQSISCLVRAVTIFSDFKEAQGDLGAAYFRSGQYDSAEVHAKIALRLNPGNLDAVNNLASVYGVQKKYPQALPLFKQAININPRKGQPYTNAGLTYLNLGKLDSGIYYLKMAISVDPGNNSPFELLASAYHSLGVQDSAKKYEAIAQKNNHQFKL